MSAPRISAAELPLLDASRLTIERGADNRLRLRLGDGQMWEGVVPVATFPYSHREEFIRFNDAEGREIGLLEHLDLLEPASRAVLEEELERRYFVPEIQRIHRLRSRHGVLLLDTTTDRGPRRFEVASRDDIRTQPDGQVLIRDADGNRYRIRNYRLLDPLSRRLLEPQL
jgi:hypothetical protein